MKLQSAFQAAVLEYYKDNRRDLPWRVPVIDDKMGPYNIMVSEIMLQQTQAGRVVGKYNDF